jgi:hypothetical protein
MTERIRTVLIVATILVSGGAASIWLGGSIAAQERFLPADIGDLSNCVRIEVKDGSGAVALRGHFVEQPEDDDDIERKAELIGSGTTAAATGQAEVEISRTDNRLDQEVEVSVNHLTPGATYAVFVDEKPLGTFQTDKDGKAELELATAPVRQP